MLLVYFLKLKIIKLLLMLSIGIYTSSYEENFQLTRKIVITTTVT